MIKDVFVFSKNSWHMKLMNWIWGYSHKDFSNMCPYFWLSVLNVFIVPFVATYKALKLFVFFVLEKIIQIIADYTNYCEDKLNKWADKIIGDFDDVLESKKFSSKFLEKLSTWDYRRDNSKYNILWNKLTYDQKSKVQDILRQRDAEEWRIRNIRYMEEENKRKERQKKFEPIKNKIKNNRVLIGKMTVWIKRAAVAVGASVLLYFVYLFGKLLVYIYSRIDWPVVGKWTIIVLVTLVAIAVAILLIIGLFSLIKHLWCKYGEFCVPCDARREKLGNAIEAFFTAIVIPFVWFGRSVVSVWEFAMAMKNDNCPAIEWKEDDQK